MLPMLCTLETKFLKINVSFLAQSNKLSLPSTSEFSPFRNSRNLPLLKKWVTRTYSVLLIISLVLASNFQQKKECTGSIKLVNRKGKHHFYFFRNHVKRKRAMNMFLVILWLNLYPSILPTFNEHVHVLFLSSKNRYAYFPDQFCMITSGNKNIAVYA